MLATKRRVDLLLLLHTTLAAASGCLAFVFPHALEFFLIPHGERFGLRDNAGDASKVEHLAIRMYGALILAQAWICWSARRVDNAPFRRALVQAYTACFALTTLALLRAQLTEGGHLAAANWVNILVFAALTGCYAWFAFVERIAAFEGLGKGLL